MSAVLTANASNGIKVQDILSASGTINVDVDEMRQVLEDQLQAAYDELMATATPQTAGPALWWDMYAYGPFKAPVPPFPAPNEVVRLGETVYVASILYLNRFYPYPSSADVLSNFALPYTIAWDTNNVTTFAKETALSGSFTKHFKPGKAWYVDVIAITPEHEGIHELNLRGRITGCEGELAPPFAGYATLVYEFDSSLFTPGMHTRYQGPVRFSVYR